MTSATRPIAPAGQDRALAAAGAIGVYAAVISFLDNYVRVIAAEAGLWQFHATRAAMALPLLMLLAPLLRSRIRPHSWRAVVARSAIHGTAMLIYFGALAFLPVAQVAAGLFTSPVWVLLIQRLAYGRPITGLQVLAVAAGFGGVILVLGPEAMAGATLASLLPVLAGLLYAAGNVATREWCAGESALTLLAGFFAALGLFGLTGLLALHLVPLAAAEGAAGFIARGWTAPTATFLFWTAMQAAGSILGVGLMIRAYQIATAARVSVYEYMLLPASAFWGWIIWTEVPTLPAVAGMALIAGAGALIALAPPARARSAG